MINTQIRHSAFKADWISMKNKKQKIYWSNDITQMENKIIWIYLTMPSLDSGVENHISWQNKVNTMAPDALAPFSTSTSAAMLLTIRRINMTLSSMGK